MTFTEILVANRIKAPSFLHLASSSQCYVTSNRRNQRRAFLHRLGPVNTGRSFLHRLGAFDTG